MLNASLHESIDSLLPALIDAARRAWLHGSAATLARERRWLVGGRWVGVRPVGGRWVGGRWVGGRKPRE